MFAVNVVSYINYHDTEKNFNRVFPRVDHSGKDAQNCIRAKFSKKVTSNRD